MLLTIGGNVALAHVNNNWPKNTVAQSRPVGLGYRQPNQTQWLRNNRTQGVPAVNLQQQQPQNNSMRYHQPGYKPAVQNPQLPIYDRGTFNQTRPSWQQPKVPNQAQYPSYGQHGAFNQTRHFGTNYPQPSLRTFNQTRPLGPQPVAPKLPNNLQYPSNGQQNYVNQTRPSWPQPSAPQLPMYPSQPNNKPVLPSHQTNLYPKLPSQGQAMLSYEPGHYPSPSGNSNKNPPHIQGSSNPYANIFN